MASWGTLPLVCPPGEAAPPLSPSQMQSVLLSSPDSHLLRVPDPPVWRGSERGEGGERGEGEGAREEREGGGG